MPFWRPVSRSLLALRRRYNIDSSLSEMWTGLVNVVQVDHHWQQDTLDIYGLFIQSPAGDGVNLLACSIEAQQREVLVHKIEFSWTGASITGHTVHVFTQLQTYNPYDISSFLSLPWLQTKVRQGDAGQLGSVFGLSGLGSALQVVNVPPFGPITTIGPTYPSGIVFGTGGAFHNKPAVIWDFQNPPIRLKPFQSIVVQEPLFSLVGSFLNVNFYYSEREPQGDVG